MTGIRDAAQRASVITPLISIPGSRIGEVAARFDVVMGYTVPDKIAAGTPKIFSLAGIANAASFIPATSTGSRMRIFDNGFTMGEPRELQTDDIVDGLLPETLNGVSVQVMARPPRSCLSLRTRCKC